MLLPFLASALASFSVPDPSAWHYRLDCSFPGVFIPGADDFYPGEAKFFEFDNSRAQAGGPLVKITAHTPEIKGFNFHAGVGVGEREQAWDAIMANLLIASIPGSTPEQKFDVPARMEVSYPVVELYLGTEYHLAKRHFLGLQGVAHFPLGDAELTYELEEKTITTMTAPSSFDESLAPRLMATYTYRWFDRIDVGAGVGLWQGEFFKTTPEVDIPSIGHMRLADGETGTWWEFHVGWTFGRPRPTAP
ncbi:MAG TPA: hypothetical protein PKO15_16750 [Fibrobacteria bacterium]|nr:hypothetical protein [Fibrobacteria bacterium]HOX51912.1 hypothetical protein [Fibrobacteria bacterium]